MSANVPKTGQLASGARQGTNSDGFIGYLGPCLSFPRGVTDTYLLTLYAVDVELNIAAGDTKQQVLEAASGHMLAQGQLEGTYQM